MNTTAPEPARNVVSDLLNEPRLKSPCCHVATVKLGIDYRCPKCRRVYKLLSENQKERKAFER
jgi:hypothetical protein